MGYSHCCEYCSAYETFWAADKRLRNADAAAFEIQILDLDSELELTKPTTKIQEDGQHYFGTKSRERPKKTID